MQIFAQRDLRQFLEGRRGEARQAVENASDDAILGGQLDAVVDRLAAPHRVARLVLACDEMSRTNERRPIPADQFPEGRGFHVVSGKTYPKEVFTYHIPFSGNRALLNYGDTQFAPWTMNVNVLGTDVTLEIIDFSNDPTKVEQQALEYREQLKTAAIRFDAEVANFNESLTREATDWVRRRRAEAEHRLGVISALTVPVRRVPGTEVPRTLSVPITKRPVAVQLVPETAPRQQEWVLSPDLYQAILDLIHDWGVVMERHPSIYEGKDEEALRDLFILLLSPHFQYAGGETFNKRGKTDILIRHEKQNVFVAECKIWRGEKELTKAVDQLLSYLTWRDSKAALILFVRNKDVQKVIQQIEPTLRAHACFLAQHNGQAGRLHFDLRLTTGNERAAKCAVLVFHLPGAEAEDP